MELQLKVPAELETDADAALVLSWRYEVLFRAGYSTDEAFQLARDKADLHLATELLERGCPSELALQILL